jgi:hypothetical protein
MKYSSAGPALFQGGTRWIGIAAQRQSLAIRR